MSLLTTAQAVTEDTTTHDLTTLVQSSQYRDTFTAVLMGVAISVWIFKQLYPFLAKKNQASDTADGRLANGVILQKDADGQYVLLGLPRMLRDFNAIMEEFTGQMRQLVNHQSSTLKKLDETGNHTQRMLGQLAASVEKFHRAMESRLRP